MRLFSFLLICCFAFASQATAAPALPDLTIALGERNTSRGLSVPSEGDGLNVPENVAGSAARRMSGAGAQYLYVAVNHPAYVGPRDLYVVVEALDDVFSRVAIQYDRASPNPDINTKYAPAEGSMFLTGASGRGSDATSKQHDTPQRAVWRTGYFYLPRARLGRGQNFGADFRLAARNVAVRRITVTTRRPEGFQAGANVDAASLAALRVSRPPGMEYTIGSDPGPADAAIYRALSVSSVESYVHWAEVEPRENQWDWSKWDKQVAVLRAAGLKWVPFLIAGPAYATPLWFQNGGQSHFYRCLEHGRDSRVQSLFNPELPRYAERFIQAFAARYRDAGVIESVLLGVTGIYGESIYPAGPEGGWTAGLTGDYHNHAGWWAADAHAVAAFRAAMQKRYRTIAALNAAWRTGYGSFTGVSTFLPDKAPSDPARADFVEWYQQAMTDWSVLWVQATRRAFPATPIYLCTGGDGDPVLGADFTAQTKAIAPWGAGVRITNEGSDYASNFCVTREVATATRLYNTFCGFEPASAVDAGGVVARIYNATASGARQLHDYAPNVMENLDALRNLRANIRYLAPRRPRLDAAMYLSRESWAFDAGAIARTYTLARRLRDLTDVDFVTRRSVADGALRGHRLLVLAESPVLEPAAARAIESWVRGGGILVAATRQSETVGARLHDNAAWRAALLSNNSNGQANDQAARSLLTPALRGAAPARWALNVGGADDDEWLFGDWFDRERGLEWPELPGATKRWSGARPGIYLPVGANADHILRLFVHVPARALRPGGIEVSINDRVVGRIERAETQTMELRVPAAALGRASVARLQIAPATWKPSDTGSGDTRALGVALRRVEWQRAGVEEAAAGGAASDGPTQNQSNPVSLHGALDKRRLAALTRRVGRGRTIFLPGLASDTNVLARVLEALLRDTPSYLPGVPPLAPLDGRLDARFVTQTANGILTYDGRAAHIVERIEPSSLKGGKNR